MSLQINTNDCYSLTVSYCSAFTSLRKHLSLFDLYVIWLYFMQRLHQMLLICAQSCNFILLAKGWFSPLFLCLCSHFLLISLLLHESAIRIIERWGKERKRVCLEVDDGGVNAVYSRLLCYVRPSITISH